MLTLRKINPSLLYSFGEVDDIHLNNEGLCLINGENKDDPGSNNDAGKSNLVKSITRLLYDEDRSSTTINSIPNKVLNQGCASCITFDVGESSYRVILTRSWRKKKVPFDVENSEIINVGDLYKGNDVYLEILENGVWRDIRESSLSKTKDKIQRILGLTFEQFESSSYMAQNSSFLALSGKPGDKFKLVEPFLDFSVWDEAASKLLSLLEDFDSRIKDLESNLKIAEATFSNIESSQDLHEEYKIVCEELNNLKNQENLDVSKIKKELQELEAKIEDVSEKIYECKNSQFYFSFQNELTAYQAELDDMQKDKKSKTDKAKSDKLGSSAVISFLEKDKAVSEAEISRLKNNIEKTLSLGATCDACGQEVKNKESTLNKLQSELETQVNIRKNILEKIESFKKGVESSYREKLREIEDKFAEREEFVRKEVQSLLLLKKEEEKAFNLLKKINLENLNKETSSLNKRKYMILESEKQNAIRESKIESTEQRMRDIVARRMRVADQIQKYQQEISKIKVEIEKITSEKAQYELLEKHLGSKGIRNFETMTILTEMSDYAAEYLAKLSGGMVNISISPYKESKDSSALFSGVSKITEVVKDSFKEGVPPTLSGGAVYRQMSIAIMFALRAIAYSRDLGTNVLFLDEIDRDMSELNTDRLVSFFNEFRKSCPSIFLISHNERLKNTIHPDKEITIVRESGVSKVL